MPPDLPGLTVQDCLAGLRKSFADNNIDTADLDARLLVEAVSGLDHAGMILHHDQTLSETQIVVIEQFKQQRLTGEPVSRILGEREFYGRKFAINRNVLDPRPDTETLIDLALTVARQQGTCRILDIGCGSGAIVVTLLCELPDVTALATDISADALQTTRQNAVRLGVADRLELCQTSWCADIDGKFDLVVSNPPYIISDTIEGLARDVKDFDPHLALDGGKDGLDAYRQIARQASKRLRPTGMIMLETGFDQGVDVVGIFMGQGFKAPTGFQMINKDLSGNDRVVILQSP